MNLVFWDAGFVKEDICLSDLPPRNGLGTGLSDQSLSDIAHEL
jgi:hypothetical protein